MTDPARRRWWILAMASVQLTIASTPSAQDADVLTLRAAVAEALRQNDEIVNQQDAGHRADLGVRLARNVFMPKVVPNVFGSFGQTNVSSQDYRVDVTQRFLTGTQLRVGVGTSTAQVPSLAGGPSLNFYNTDTTVTLSQPLLRGFGPSIARRPLTVARLRGQEADRERTITEQQVAVQTAAAYYHVVAQQAFIEVARTSLERAVKLREASEARQAAGLVSQLDVLRAQQLVSQAASQLYDAESAVEDALDQLSQVLGRPTASALRVAGEIPQPSREVIDPERAAGVALANRLDLKIVEARAADTDFQVSFARNQLLPQVDVNFALTRRQTANSFVDSFGLDRFVFATFFTIAMPIDRTPQLIEHEHARIERERQRRDVEALRRQVSSEARRAVRERNRLLRAYEAATTRVDISRQEVEIAQLRFERGLSNNLDVVTAEGNLVDAESSRIRALADLATAALSLRAVVGVLDPRSDLLAAAPPAALMP